MLARPGNLRLPGASLRASALAHPARYLHIPSPALKRDISHFSQVEVPMLGAACRFDPLPRSSATTRNNLVALVLRLGLGAIFLFHGWNKLDLDHGRWGADWTAAYWGSHLGQPMPEALGYLWLQLAVAWGEFLGGIFLLLGLFTRVAAVGMIVIQAGAIAMVTHALGFFAQGGGWEYNFLLIAACLAQFVVGGGAWSLDYLVLKALSKEVHGKEVPDPGTLQPV
jgi:putative oxidoreductase